MKATITIEQFNNGISIKSKSENEDVAVVALDRDQMRVIGEMIWEDVCATMNLTLANTVKMTIEYQAVKEEEK